MSLIHPYPSEMIVWGGTGQAKVLRPIIENLGSRIVAVFNDFPDAKAPLPGVPLLIGGRPSSGGRAAKTRQN